MRRNDNITQQWKVGVTQFRLIPKVLNSPFARLHCCQISQKHSCIALQRKWFAAPIDDSPALLSPLPMLLDFLLFLFRECVYGEHFRHPTAAIRTSIRCRWRRIGLCEDFVNVQWEIITTMLWLYLWALSIKYTVAPTQTDHRNDSYFETAVFFPASFSRMVAAGVQRTAGEWCGCKGAWRHALEYIVVLDYGTQLEFMRWYPVALKSVAWVSGVCTTKIKHSCNIADHYLITNSCSHEASMNFCKQIITTTVRIIVTAYSLPNNSRDNIHGNSTAPGSIKK